MTLENLKKKIKEMPTKREPIPFPELLCESKTALQTNHFCERKRRKKMCCLRLFVKNTCQQWINLCTQIWCLTKSRTFDYYRNATTIITNGKGRGGEKKKTKFGDVSTAS
eukprot:TRINITY_DN24935_c0_g1_i1.p1 TRINITY_DN24935_c0_g1~~TRINITY_DN24935_c0_g1_i1.p1  ORF type:complete len:126 (-),score=13.06 TRINITY_DN24935_c0_g1_i1:58-387(-)